MIEPEDYRLPTKQTNNKLKPKADPATLEYLEALPFRPHGVEW
jgi:hypothetical protein